MDLGLKLNILYLSSMMYSYNLGFLPGFLTASLAHAVLELTLFFDFDFDFDLDFDFSL